MKTFNDLDFKEGNRARMKFENGYSASVVFGDLFYSNGIDTYELAILNDKGEIDYNTGLTEDVFGHQTEKQITEIMKQIQELQCLKEKSI